MIEIIILVQGVCLLKLKLLNFLRRWLFIFTCEGAQAILEKLRRFSDRPPTSF